jgi:hypothetical protein
VSYARPLPGALLIKTKPDSANLRLNGALLDAKTPYRIDNMPPGRYYVQVTKDGHHPLEKELVVESNRVTEWEVELTQTAVRVRIEIEKKVQDVDMLINGEERGTAPGVIYLEPGSYHVRLKKPGYRLYEKVIEVPPDSVEMRLSAKLESAKTLPARFGVVCQSLSLGCGCGDCCSCYCAWVSARLFANTLKLELVFLESQITVKPQKLFPNGMKNYANALYQNEAARGHRFVGGRFDFTRLGGRSC